MTKKRSHSAIDEAKNFALVLSVVATIIAVPLAIHAWFEWQWESGYHEQIALHERFKLILSLVVPVIIWLVYISLDQVTKPRKTK